jgi:hypothetical protein
VVSNKLCCLDWGYVRTDVLALPVPCGGIVDPPKEQCKIVKRDRVLVIVDLQSLCMASVAFAHVLVGNKTPSLRLEKEKERLLGKTTDSLTLYVGSGIQPPVYPTLRWVS